MASFPILITSFNISSIPGDLFAFSLLIAASNSSSVLLLYNQLGLPLFRYCGFPYLSPDLVYY